MAGGGTYCFEDAKLHNEGRVLGAGVKKKRRGGEGLLNLKHIHTYKEAKGCWPFKFSLLKNNDVCACYQNMHILNLKEL